MLSPVVTVAQLTTTKGKDLNCIVKVGHKLPDCIKIKVYL